MARSQLMHTVAGLVLGIIPALAAAGSLTDVLTETVRDLRVIERSGVCNANPFKQNQFGVPVAPACAPVVAKCPVRMIPLTTRCKGSFVGGPTIPTYYWSHYEEDTVNRTGNETTCTTEAYTRSGLVRGYAGKSCTFQVSGIGETVGVRGAWGWCYDGFNYQEGYDVVGTQSGSSYCVSQAQLNSAAGTCQSERLTLKAMCVTRPPESTLQKLQNLQMNLNDF